MYKRTCQDIQPTYMISITVVPIRTIPDHTSMDVYTITHLGNVHYMHRTYTLTYITYLAYTIHSIHIAHTIHACMNA